MEADWVGSSPVIAEDINLLFVGLEFGLFRKRGGIVALNPKTGEKVWEQKMSEFVHCTPLYLKKKKMVAIGGNDGCVRLFSAKKGKSVWTFRAGGEVRYSLESDTENNYLFFGCADGNLYVIDVDSGSQILKYEAEAEICGKPLILGDNVIFSSLDKRIYSLNYKKNEINWIFSTSGRAFSSPAFIEESIFVGSNDGRLYELDPDDGSLRSFAQFTERITNSVVYSNESKHFFVLTQANEVYCLSRQI
jgi:outer membrane protein assembly factor BamB